MINYEAAKIIDILENIKSFGITIVDRCFYPGGEYSHEEEAADKEYLIEYIEDAMDQYEFESNEEKAIALEAEIKKICDVYHVCITASEEDLCEVSGHITFDTIENWECYSTDWGLIETFSSHEDAQSCENKIISNIDSIINELSEYDSVESVFGDIDKIEEGFYELDKQGVEFKMATGDDPVFCHYSGQYNSQPAYISIDFRDEDVEALYKKDFIAIPADVHNGSRLWIKINNRMNADEINAILMYHAKDIVDLIKTANVYYQNGNATASYNEDLVAKIEDTIGQFDFDEGFREVA